MPVHQDVLFCRTQGHDKLCDGFVCSEGSDCASGCCATFGTLKSDYCQPIVEGVCPVHGFTYGEHGDIYRNTEELAQTGSETDPQDLLSIPKRKSDTPELDDNASEGNWFQENMVLSIVLACLAVCFLCCCCGCLCCGRRAASEVAQY